MEYLLHQIIITPAPIEISRIIIITLLISNITVFFGSFLKNNNKKPIITFTITSIILIIILILNSNYDSNAKKSAINKKDYTLKINSDILELISNSPYLESKKFKIIYQDYNKIQVEYNNQYYDIDKSKEKINETN